MIGSSLLCGEPSDRRVEVVSECRGDRRRLQRRAVRPEKFIVLAPLPRQDSRAYPIPHGKNMLFAAPDRRERPRRKPPLRERDGRPGLVKIPGDIRKLPQSREQPLGGTLAQGEPAVPHEQEHSPLLDPARFFFRRAHGEHIGHASFGTPRRRRGRAFLHNGAPFGRQTVAPRSIIAWFHSPGRSRSMLSASMARKRLRTLASMMSSAMPPTRAATRRGDCRPPQAPARRRRWRRWRSPYSRRRRGEAQKLLARVGENPRRSRLREPAPHGAGSVRGSSSPDPPRA